MRLSGDSENVGELAQDRSFPLLDMVDALPAAIYRIDANGRLEHYNKAAVELWGREPDCVDERLCGPWKLYYPNGRPMPHEASPMAEALRTGRPIRNREMIVERPNGDRVTILAHATPLQDPSGEVAGALNMLVDITGHKRAEAQLKSRIQQLQAVSELSMAALAGGTLQALFVKAVARLAKGLDVEMAKVLEYRPAENNLLLRAGVGWHKGLVGKACVGLDSQAGYTLSINEPVVVEDIASETRFDEPPLLLDHGVRSGMSVVIRGADDMTFGVLGAHTSDRRKFTADDIHFIQSIANVLAMAIERQAYRDRQAMLVSELSHRMKNTLFVIKAIARQAVKNGKSPEEFVRSFEGRIGAFAQVFDMLTANKWSGASFHKLATIVLGDQTAEDQIDLELEDVILNPEGAQVIAMVFYELMTNAAKYGALSNTRGKILLAGRCKRIGVDGFYHLSWRETGGPPVKKPKRYGFGSKFIESAVQHQCGGTVSMDWQRDGLIAEFILRLSSIS